MQGTRCIISCFFSVCWCVFVFVRLCAAAVFVGTRTPPHRDSVEIARFNEGNAKKNQNISDFLTLTLTLTLLCVHL
jgi:hypothetical protein